MRIGVPREIFLGEKRVATVPDVVTKLVKLGFDLPSGSYATMLLRELMVKTVYRRQNELH